MPVSDRAPGREPDAGPDAGPGASTAGGRAARWLIAVLLLATAVLDLTRCGMVLAAARHPAPAAGLVVAGLAGAALSSWAMHGCLARRRWPAWAAVLIGATSAPQAAASGFGAPYTIPDTATAAVGILLAVAVLATAGRTLPGLHAENPCPIDTEANCTGHRETRPPTSSPRQPSRRSTKPHVWPQPGSATAVPCGAPGRPPANTNSDGERDLLN